MYNHIFARSFSKSEQKIFGKCAFVVCICVAFTLCTIFKPIFQLSILKSEVSTSSGGVDMIIVRVQQEIDRNDGKMIGETLGAPSHVTQTKMRNSGPSTKPLSNGNHTKIVESLVKPACTHPSKNHIFQEFSELGHSTIDCNFSEALSDYCNIKGTIRIHGQTSTIFARTLAGNMSRLIKPYPRKGSDAMKSVREWTIKPSRGYPHCNMTHTQPAILFSTSGFSGNYFHAFSDIIIPLFTNSRIYNRKVHLLATDYKSWWISKFQVLLNQLSYHPVVDIDRDDRVHCYQNAIVGLRSNKELGIDSSRYSMKDFRGFLRSTYSLKRRLAVKMKSNDNMRPRLMIISRKATRRLTNEGSIIKMARKIGYEVVIANVTRTTNLSTFAQVVNSCDVFMGVHGAGLTNMVFLPDNAVVVQVVPLGGMERLAETDFGRPSKEMNLRYLKYSVRLKESSLETQYAAGDVVLRDPMAIHRQGWDAFRDIYLIRQNVKLNVRTFRFTLLKALELLRN